MSPRKTNHLQLIADVAGELAGLAESTDVHGFLQAAAERLARHLDTAVCSIYLHDDARAALILEATVGLRRESIGRVTLNLSEGLVGKAMRELRTIVVDEASKHPDYRYFPEAGEETFDCFLAAPILRGIERIGVLVVQREAARTFNEDEVAVVNALAAQLAGAVGHARALLAVDSRKAPAVPAPSAPLLRGKGASGGCALGRAFVYRKKASLTQAASSQSGTVSRDEVVDAFDRTASDLARTHAHLMERLPEAAVLIFESHTMILQDENFRGQVFARMDRGMNGIAAVASAACHYMDLFEASEHDYMREKAADIEDLASRIIDQLQAEESQSAETFEERIVIARDLLPSDILKLALDNVGGIVLAGGGMTSHVAILARSLQVPTVIVNEPSLLNLAKGTHLALDGDRGNVYINPGSDVRRALADRMSVEKKVDQDARDMEPRTRTADGVRVRLLANINLLGELDLATRLNAEGIGLYRTEFPFLVRDTFPTSEEQETLCRYLFEHAGRGEITIRTLDAGGDKMLACYDNAGEANPELGLRSTRFALAHPEIFESQLRAIVRAWDPSIQLKIMFPMISSPDEFARAKNLLLSCIEHENIKADAPLSIGMMLELPAVVEMMDEFVGVADFFSVGTNDFVQYMLAADRANDKVADYYCSHHPSVLRALMRMITTALRAGRDISVCGEMAHDPRYVPFFVGIGVRTLSVDPRWLPTVQKTIRSRTLADMETYAQMLLRAHSVEEVGRLLA